MSRRWQWWLLFAFQNTWLVHSKSCQPVRQEPHHQVSIKSTKTYWGSQTNTNSYQCTTWKSSVNSSYSEGYHQCQFVSCSEKPENQIFLQKGIKNKENPALTLPKCRCTVRVNYQALIHFETKKSGPL